MTLINDLQEGQQFHQVFFCKQKSTGIRNSTVTKNEDKKYYSLKLQDKTGVIDGKVWELNNEIGSFEAGDYIMADGEVTVYKSQKQLKIRVIRKAKEGEYAVEDYMPTTDLSVDSMYQSLMALKNKVSHPKLRQLLDSFFVEDDAFIQKFRTHSAAKSVHHSFVGGLLQHTLRVTEMCDFLADQYPIINRDLILTAAMFHDIGKVEELSDFPLNDYTDDGQLLGHIVIGYEMVKKRMDEIGHFPKKLATELLHCILSHQGKLEFGSPKKPSLIEALALSFADDADAKLEIMIEEFDKNPTLDFLGLNRFLDSNIRRTTPFT